MENYFVAKTLEDAVFLKEKYGSNINYLAGGTDLNCMGGKGVKKVIDINNLDLNKIYENNEFLIIGSLVTFQELMDDEKIPEGIRRACKYMHNINVRQMATIGGNLGQRNTCSDLLAAFIALEGDVKLSNGKTIKIVEYILDLTNDHMVLEVLIPKKNLRIPYGSSRYVRVSLDLSILTVATSLEIIENKLKSVSIAIGGVAKRTTLFNDSLQQFVDKEINIDEIINFVKNEIKPITDVRGSAEFKRYLVGELLTEALKEAVEKYIIDIKKSAEFKRYLVEELATETVGKYIINEESSHVAVGLVKERLEKELKEGGR